MTEQSKRANAMLFNYETVTRTDFRQGEIKPLVKTVYKEKSPCKRIRPPRLKDTNTLTDWRIPNVPFDVFGSPKPILWTRPTDLQKPYTSREDLDRKHVQMTRPRLIMTPAQSLDDVDDECRDMLIKDIYISTSQKALTEAIELAGEKGKGIKAPLPLRAAPAKPIYLKELKPPYVSPEWRMDSASWDYRSNRSYVDPTKEFWVRRNTDESVSDETTKNEL